MHIVDSDVAPSVIRRDPPRSEHEELPESKGQQLLHTLANALVAARAQAERGGRVIRHRLHGDPDSHPTPETIEVIERARAKCQCKPPPEVRITWAVVAVRR